MLRRNERNLDNIPAGTLGIIAIDGCQARGKEVDHFITTWRHEDGHKFMDDVVFSGYQRDSYLVNAHVPRFGSGEAKGVIDESVPAMMLTEAVLSTVAKLRKDAERYQYLRDKAGNDILERLKDIVLSDKWDAEIDAAIAKEKAK